MLELDMIASVREDVLAIAQEASAVILEVYEGDFDVDHKADASPLTDADLAAHHCIVAGLSRLTPDIPVLSEESAHTIALDVRRTWSRLWLVDPLDGTREFVKRNGEFTVNIALIDHGVPVFGVIQAPVSGVLWHGVPGHGALRRDASGEHPVRVRQPATAPLRVAASRSHLDPRTEALMTRIGEVETVGLGSSLKFCRLAEGRMDVYPRFGPTSEWDTAAGQAILEGAGGAVLDPRGRPFRYNQRDTLLNGDFIALGDTTLPWRDWL
ncbi:MAG TPA: 3'(2'),5'-bisphosphate nucleotidase CysQ [Luteimonas sp.]|nr:3'(2'),5'-bisphosphate nucleotidase CysQ [Luteimonas sp.]HRP71528.1 3'(2'),5'-bisphosphate nucleotidase CysQ [Luteimonas sp.]